MHHRRITGRVITHASPFAYHEDVPHEVLEHRMVVVELEEVPLVEDAVDQLRVVAKVVAQARVYDLEDGPDALLEGRDVAVLKHNLKENGQYKHTRSSPR